MFFLASQLRCSRQAFHRLVPPMIFIESFSEWKRVQQGCSASIQMSCQLYFQNILANRTKGRGLLQSIQKYQFFATSTRVYTEEDFQQLKSISIHSKYNNKMSSFQNSLLNEPRIEDSILFEVNEQTLIDMNLTEHICRLEQMSRFLGDAINKNRGNLYDLREVVKNQINSLKNASQALQTNIRDETTQLKNIFEPAIGSQIKKINELKAQVGKINSEQLSTKKYVLNLQAAISHCETEIGFRQ